MNDLHAYQDGPSFPLKRSSARRLKVCCNTRRGHIRLQPPSTIGTLQITAPLQNTNTVSNSARQWDITRRQRWFGRGHQGVNLGGQRRHQRIFQSLKEHHRDLTFRRTLRPNPNLSLQSSSRWHRRLIHAQVTWKIREITSFKDKRWPPQGLCNAVIIMQRLVQETTSWNTAILAWRAYHRSK